VAGTRTPDGKILWVELTETFSWRGRDVVWSRIGSGDPVVFCHGTPWSSRTWARFAGALSRDFCVYLWDMPGYGQSSKHPEHDVDLGIQGELFTDLLAEWNLDAPHVVAHDFGGAVSLRALLLHHARFASLCLVDVVALTPWGSPFFRLVHDHTDVFAALPPAVHAGALAAYIQTASFRGLRTDELAELTAPWLTDEGQAAFYRQIAQADESFTNELEAPLSDIDVPVHIIWGEQDTWIPVDRATRLVAAIHGASLHIVPDAGHLIHYDAPAALADELRAWLQP
jgi:pimeloyl-ACP methyl ester carboxylesterase